MISPLLSTAQHPPEQMLINVSFDALLNLFRVQSFFTVEELGRVLTNRHQLSIV
jgi:hypothetical protein